MLFSARGHRLTANSWEHKGKSIALSHEAAVFERLRKLGAPWITGLKHHGPLNAGGVLYGRIKRAVGMFDTPEYIECLVHERSRHEGDNAIGFGNCIVRVPSAGHAIGFVHIVCRGLAFECRCRFDRDQTRFESHWNDGMLLWSMPRAETVDEHPVGAILLREGLSCVELRVRFPSRRQEDSGRLIKAELLHNGEVIGYALRSFNPVFHRAYRVSLWLKDVVPVYEAVRDTIGSALLQNAIIVAILGGWFCYKPVKGERSAG